MTEPKGESQHVTEQLVETDKFPQINWQPDQTRFQILLVKAGFSKVSSISIFPCAIEVAGQDEAVWGEVDKQKVAKTIDELKSLGFITDDNQDDQNAVHIDYAVDEKVLNEYKSRRLSNTLADAEQGLIYGIPQTAIEAFPDNNIKMNELPPEIANDHRSELLPFLPSRDHFKEEWQEFVSQAEIAASKSPDLVKSLNLSEFFPELDNKLLL